MNISKYEKAGFVGSDVSLEISLCEYGLIWKEYKRSNKKTGFNKGDWKFIFGTKWVEYDHNNDKYWKEFGYTDTDWGCFRPEDILNEDWIDWKVLADVREMTVEEFREQDFGYLMYELVSYYGSENFGVNQ